MQTAAASLVAAIPAGILAALLVMMFLSHMENLTGLMPVFLGLTLVLVAAVVLMPFGILIFSGKSAAKAAAPKADKKSSKTDDDDAEVRAGDEILADEDGEIGETVEFHGDSSDLEAFDDAEALEATDDELFDEEEEAKPKKKGKKK